MEAVEAEQLAVLSNDEAPDSTSSRVDRRIRLGVYEVVQDLTNSKLEMELTRRDLATHELTNRENRELVNNQRQAAKTDADW